MEVQQIAPLTRSGVPGLDVFKIARQSISGFLHSFKTGDPSRPRQPFTTHLEERLATYLEYHPHVRFYQRGDASEACASAYRLVTDLGTPYRINYVFDGKSHEYLPDFVGTLCDGGLLIAEAGRESEKRKGQPLAKAEAARTVAQYKGGIYVIGTDENLSQRRHQNLLRLHAYRQRFPTYDEIATTILKQWPWGELHSINEFVQRFGSRWSEPEVEATVWKLAGDAAAVGRLLVDLTEVTLSRSTPLALLDPSSPPILPDPLPSLLEELASEASAASPSDELHDDLPIELSSGLLPGPTFDASSLEKPEQQARFHRNLAAVTAVLAGGTLEQTAQTHGMAVFPLWRLVQRTKVHGQIACAPRATYHRDRALHIDFQQLIRKLYTQPLRPTVMAVYEDVQLKQLAHKLSEQEGKLVLGPTYKQVWSFIQTISHEQHVSEARSGLKHPLRERTSPQSFVLSVLYPGHICQVDEHTLDLKVVTLDGIVITRRVHGAVLICVKTAAILGAILSLDSLIEEDYMRLVKQSLEPKDRLTALYECRYPWPCFGKPAVIFHDRGKIFTSQRATQVLVDRLGITTEQAPPYAPSAKGTVEALFTWVTRKFTHRLPGTTKATTRDRGAYDSMHEAQKAGITLDVLEKLFVQAIVDGYMQEWDKLRRQKRLVLWEESVREKGIPRSLSLTENLF